MDRNGNKIKAIAANDEISMTELASRLNISRQALYKRLDGDMRLSHFLKVMNALGYEIYYGKAGKARKFE